MGREIPRRISSVEAGATGSEVDKDELKAIVDANPKAPISDITEKLSVDQTTVPHHLKKIGKAKNSINNWTGTNLTSNGDRIFSHNKSDHFLDALWSAFKTNPPQQSATLRPGWSSEEIPKSALH